MNGQLKRQTRYWHHHVYPPISSGNHASREEMGSDRLAWGTLLVSVTKVGVETVR